MTAYVTVTDANWLREAINIWKFDKNVRELHGRVNLLLTSEVVLYYA